MDIGPIYVIKLNDSQSILVGCVPPIFPNVVIRN